MDDSMNETSNYHTIPSLILLWLELSHMSIWMQRRLENTSSYMPERRKNRKWWSTSSSTILSQLEYMLPDGKDLVCLLTTACSTSKPMMAHITHLINMFWMNAQISVKHNLTRQASERKQLQIYSAPLILVAAIP